MLDLELAIRLAMIHDETEEEEEERFDFDQAAHTDRSVGSDDSSSSLSHLTKCP